MQQYPPNYQPPYYQAPYPSYYPPPRPQFDPNWVKQERRSTRKTLTRIGLALFLAMAVAQVTSLLLTLWLQQAAPGAVENSWVLLALSTMPLYLLGIPLILLVVWKMPSLPATEETPLSAGQFIQLFIIAYAVLYISNLVSMAGIALLSVIKGSPVVNPSEALMMDLSPLASFIYVGLLAPIIEEWVFRGVLLRRLLPHGEKFAIVISALCFGLFHGNFFQMLFAFALGLVLAYAALRTGTLIYSIFIHIIVNTFNGVLLPAVMVYGGLGATALFGFVILGVVIAGVVLAIVHRKKVFFTPVPPPLTEGQRIVQTFSSPGMILYILLCLGLSVYMIAIY